MLNRPILITGAARSGTSMTAGVISICGAFGGVVNGPNGYNKRGMFENGTIRQQYVKPYLRSIDCYPLGQNPLPDLTSLKLVNKMEKDGVNWWYDRITRVMKIQGYEFESQWYYKGAKMCLIYPLWHNAFPDAKWVIVRRKPEDIINSCMKTGFMRAFSTPKMWADWVKQHEDLFREMIDQGLDVQEVWPEKMIYGNFKEMEYIINKLELKWNSGQVEKFISPDLWKGGKNNG